MKRFIPNWITCLNVTAGTLAIFMAMYGLTVWAAALVLLAMVFDFFDGMAARLLHVKSEMGKELDSLADVVSFGVAPAVLAHGLMLGVLPGGSVWCWEDWSGWERVMALTPLMIPAFSAYRLAKFNLDERQSVSFIGMPTPAHALFWVGAVLGAAYAPEVYGRLFASVTVLGCCAVILSVLLVSELPMFSLKVSGFGWRENRMRYLFLGALAVCGCVWGWAVLFMVIPLYILLSVVAFVTTLNRR